MAVLSLLKSDLYHMFSFVHLSLTPAASSASQPSPLFILTARRWNDTPFTVTLSTLLHFLHANVNSSLLASSSSLTDSSLSSSIHSLIDTIVHFHVLPVTAEEKVARINLFEIESQFKEFVEFDSVPQPLLPLHLNTLTVELKREWNDDDSHPYRSSCAPFFDLLFCVHEHDTFNVHDAAVLVESWVKRLFSHVGVSESEGHRLFRVQFYSTASFLPLSNQLDLLSSSSS